jgi:hypothetical protein
MKIADSRAILDIFWQAKAVKIDDSRVIFTRILQNSLASVFFDLDKKASERHPCDYRFSKKSMPGDSL